VGAASYIKERKRELKTLRTTEKPKDREKSEGDGRQNDDEKATSGSLSREGDSLAANP
jgi:hypothetical protein